MFVRKNSCFKVLPLFGLVFCLISFAGQESHASASQGSIENMFKSRDKTKSFKRNSGSFPCYQAFCNPTTHRAAAAVVINQPVGAACPQGTNSSQSAVLSQFKVMHPECSGSERYENNSEAVNDSGDNAGAERGRQTRTKRMKNVN